MTGAVGGMLKRDYNVTEQEFQAVLTCVSAGSVTFC